MNRLLPLISCLFLGCSTFKVEPIVIHSPEKLMLYCLGGEGIWSKLKVRENTLLTQFTTGEDFEPDADPYLEPLILLKSYKVGGQTDFVVESRGLSLELSYLPKHCIKRNQEHKKVKEKSKQRICRVTHFDYSYRGCGEYFLDGKNFKSKLSQEHSP